MIVKPLAPSLRESLEMATRTFEAALAGGPAEAYLAGRGISPDTRTHFRLGFVATDDTPGFERFQGRLAIPNICATGHVVGIKFRDLSGNDRMKYDQPAGQQARLFNTRALVTDADSIVVTEGEMDAISCHVLGIPAVAVPGASSWNERRHWRLFEGFRRVVLFRDNDDAGSELVKKVLASDLPVHVLSPPQHLKDINEALVAGLGDEVVRLVNGASK